MANIETQKSYIRNLKGDEFISSIISICETLQKDNDILTFGFLIYDETTPEYRKLLRDTDYWEALDRASGDKMMIFALADKVDTKVESTDSIGFMTAFSASSSCKTKSYSKLLKNVFSNEALLIYPSVLFFQVHNQEIYNYRLVPLKRSDINTNLQAAQKLFNSISMVLDGVDPGNYKNHREIFELVTTELTNQKYTMYILHGPKHLADFIGTVKNLLFFV